MSNPFGSESESSEEDMLTAERNAAEGWRRRGVSLAVEGDFAQAAALLGRAASVLDTDHKLHDMLSQVHTNTGNHWPAVQSAERAVSLARSLPHAYPPAYLTLARAQINFGELSLAKATLEEGIALFNLPSADTSGIEIGTFHDTLRRVRGLMHGGGGGGGVEGSD